MKKLTKLAIVIVLVSLAFTLAGCFMAGEYQMTALVMGSTSISNTENFSGTLILNYDKTFEMTYNYSIPLIGNGETTLTGTWEKNEEGNIVMTDSQENQVIATYEKGVITYDIGVGQLKFEK